MARFGKSQLRYFDPPHRTAKMVGEAIAWLACLSVVVMVLYNAHN
jgi:hypothetical protein